MGCPGLQQGAIHREVLIAEARLDIWGTPQILKKRPMTSSFRRRFLFLVNVV